MHRFVPPEIDVPPGCMNICFHSDGSACEKCWCEIIVYTCLCNVHHTCAWLDVDECKKNNGGCDSKRACNNTEGSMECGACADGWKVEGETSCAGPCYLPVNNI